MKTNILSLYKKYIQKIPGVKSYVLAAALVLVLGLTVTIFSWYAEKQRLEDQNQTKVAEQAEAVRSDITNRLNIYEQILHGASGLFEASDSVSRAEWSMFIQKYNLQNSYPGINGLGYAEYVTAPALPSYTEALKSEGFTDFSVMPEGERSDYAPITYVEPFNETSRKSVGFDVLSDPARRKAAEKARDSGDVDISDKIVLLSDSATRQPGFAMYLAVYNKASLPKNTDERKANLKGYIFAGYRAENFFGQALDKASFDAYSDIEIFDGKETNENALLYRSKNFDTGSPDKLSKQFTIKTFGREWTYRFSGLVNADPSTDHRASMIFIGGATLSVAIAGFLFLVMLTRARAIVYSEQNEAQQAKDDLLSLASHQLRTPATAVKQYLGMMLEGYTGKISKKQLPALQKAYSSNERQLDTINQILYVAKADAGRLSINPNNFDINYLVDDIGLEVSDSLEERGQSIKIERPSRKHKVYADEASIRMVIENLVSNASKYSTSGAEITIKTGTRGVETFVSITDQGVGIDEKDFDKLFKKFSRIDNDLSLQVGGSGIGLYIDKVLIELHGGHIDAKSKLGEGSTFTIFLPKNNANNLTDSGKRDTSL